MKPNNILFIINGLGFSSNTGIGGSDKRAVELIRNGLIHNPNSQLDIITTEVGQQLFLKNEQLKTTYHIIYQPKWWPKSLNKTLIGRLLSYVFCTFAAMTKIAKLPEYDSAFATSDFFFDILPAITFKVFTKKPIIVMTHHYIINPFKRAGNFSINLLNYCAQQFSFIFIKYYFDSLFLYSTPEGKHIAQKIFTNFKGVIHYSENGIDTDFIDNISASKKIYDACFVGGIRYSKGIFDLIKIWQNIIKKNSRSKLVIVGGGSQDLVARLKNEISLNKLEKNIVTTGPLDRSDTIKYMKKSRTFLFPSYEEGWGIALNEALYCGLSVNCYRLPAYEIFQKFINQSPKGDWQKMLEVQQKLQSKKIVYPKAAIKFASHFSWSNIAKKDLTFLNSLIFSSRQ